MLRSPLAAFFAGTNRVIGIPFLRVYIETLSCYMHLIETAPERIIKPSDAN